MALNQILTSSQFFIYSINLILNVGIRVENGGVVSKENEFKHIWGIYDIIYIKYK